MLAVVIGVVDAAGMSILVVLAGVVDVARSVTVAVVSQVSSMLLVR